MRILISLLFLSVCLNLTAQDESHIHTALANGDAKALAEHFDNGVELSIDKKNGIYSKKQAEIILEDFFSRHQPSAYAIKHEGGDLKRSKFSIGKFKSPTNSFRSHILYNKVDNAIQIIELRIELED